MEMAENALIIGAGGREHAFGDALYEDFDTVFFAPGNAGTELLPNGINVEVGDSPVSFAKNNAVDLTVIGPEAFLAKGWGDRFRNNGLRVVGPNQHAARLETSKLYADRFMRKYGIPTPKGVAVTRISDIEAICDQYNPLEWVLKADGLASGKGVVLPDSPDEMRATLRDMLSGEKYGGAGARGVLMQERLSGPEVSAFVLTDGTRLTILPFSQDHKRLKNGDEGPNTGGMGAYAPIPASMMSADQESQIYDIARKTVDGMNQEGTPYQGILYLGLMRANEYDGNPVVIEYNARFGDPEAQVVLPLLKQSGTNVRDVLSSLAEGYFKPHLVKRNQLAGSAALSVCLAGAEYPDGASEDVPIHGLEHSYQNVRVYHGATKRAEDDSIVTNGGRILYVTGYGESIPTAAEHAYAAIGRNVIHFTGMQYREDIGHQAR